MDGEKTLGVGFPGRLHRGGKNWAGTETNGLQGKDGIPMCTFPVPETGSSWSLVRV